MKKNAQKVKNLKLLNEESINRKLGQFIYKYVKFLCNYMVKKTNKKFT